MAQPKWLGLARLPFLFFFWKKTKKSKKNSKILWKKLWFSQIFFYQFLYDIGLYIYTVKYKFDIKIPGFLWNVSKKNQNIFKKKKIFHCIRPNPKKISSIFFIKKKNKTKIATFSCFKKIKNGYRDQFMIIH